MPLKGWVCIAEGHHGPAIADPEALAARIRQLFAERHRYQLPPQRDLAGLRRSLDVSQEALARRLGLKQSRLSKFEHHPDPRLSALHTYVARLGGTLTLLARLPDRDVHLESRGWQRQPPGRILRQRANTVGEVRVIRVLIVDDSKDGADALADVLRLMGHTAQVAYTGTEALEKVKTFTADLFLLDLALPDIDGYELVRRLRPLSGKDARFVAVTGYGPGIGGNMAANLFDEHVVKPMGPEVLLRVLALVPGISG